MCIVYDECKCSYYKKDKYKKKKREKEKEGMNIFKEKQNGSLTKREDLRREGDENGQRWGGSLRTWALNYGQGLNGRGFHIVLKIAACMLCI